MSKAKTSDVHSRIPEKDRAFWFNQHAVFPMRDASPVELETFQAAQLVADVSPEHQWECVGPFNVAGRVTSLAIHPHKPAKWYAGSATGGVWVSEDAGGSWRSTWGGYGSQNIGSLAFFENDSMAQGSLALIAATGEANMSGDAYPGTGVYWSFDEGLTWQPAFGADPIRKDVRSFPRRIGSIATKDDRFAYGSVFLDDSLPGGLYLCDFNPGGIEFQACEYWGQRSYNCHSAIFHPHDNSTLLASIEPGGAANGIWRTTDFGKTWEHLTKGLPRGEQFGRVSLAFAPSDADVVYALATSRAEAVLGVFRSTNGGNSWKEILGGRYPKERQMSYNNTIAVHPHKPQCVVWGGMHLYRTNDAGRNWRRITNAIPGKRDYAHSDHHALLWPEDDLIISGNDGGVSVTRDGGSTWEERARGMVSTMFYNVAVAPSDGRIFGGGTQDNGTLIAGVSGSAGDFVQAIPGDGAWMAFDHADAGHVFASATAFQVYRHDSGKPWDFDHWIPVAPRGISDQERNERAFTVLAIEPSAGSGVKKVWAGSDRLWRTDNNGRNWKPVSLSFDGSPISAVEISSARPRVMFVGTTNGGIFHSRDGGVAWSQSLSGIDIPARAITSIACHPKFPGTVAVTVASSGVASSGVQIWTGKILPYRHVFLSEDMGETWQDLDDGKLPNVVFYAAAWQAHDPYQLFVAGDAGVWAHDPVLTKHERGWFNVSGNLPSVVVSDLTYHKKDRTLTAATYGRGIWRVNAAKALPPPPTVPPPEAISLAVGLRLDPTLAAPVQLTPDDGATVEQTGEFSNTQVTVQRVAGAFGYQVEFLSVDSSFSIGFGSLTTEIQVCSPDSRGGKWRVWAIKPGGLRSAASAWRSFSFNTKSAGSPSAGSPNGK